MKKLILLILLLPSLCFAGLIQNAHKMAIARMSPGADVIAPTFYSAVVDTTGDIATVQFSEHLNNTALGGGEFTLDSDGAGGADNVLTYSSGDGTPTWVFDITTTIDPGETVTITFDGAANEAEDNADNDLEDFGPLAVTNNAEAAATTFADAFTDDNATLLHSHTPTTGTAWALTTDGAYDIRINTNAIIATENGGGAGITVYTTDDLGGDQYVQVQYKDWTKSGAIYLCCRIEDANNWIGIYVYGTGAIGTRLAESIDGVIDDDIGVRVQGYDEMNMKIECIGDQVKVYHDNSGSMVQQGSTYTITDGGLNAATASGIVVNTSASALPYWDNYEASSQ